MKLAFDCRTVLGALLTVELTFSISIEPVVNESSNDEYSVLRLKCTVIIEWHGRSTSIYDEAYKIMLVN